jgi:hypothetical protein
MPATRCASSISFWSAARSKAARSTASNPPPA